MAGDWSRWPADGWRWVAYEPTLPASSLYRELIDQGTGATWAALASRSLLETRDQLAGGVVNTVSLSKAL